MNKHVITVSRQWNNPKINISVDHKEISLSMELEDFEEALLQELGKYPLIVGNKQTKNKIHSAIIRVISGIKEESAKVM